MTPTTWVLTLLGSTLVGLLAWLFQRAVAGVDRKVDDTCVQMGKAVEAIQQMRIEMTGYNQLVQYLSTDVKELKQENRSLRDAHAHIDKYIAVEKALKSANIKPLST